MDSSTAPAAGWFTDPEDATTERWWSGHGWTEHTRAPLGEAPAAVAAHVDTLVAAPPAPREPEPFVFAMTPSSAAPAEAAAPVLTAPAATAYGAPAAPVAAAPAMDGYVLPNAEPMAAAAPAFTMPEAAPAFTMPEAPVFTMPEALATPQAPVAPLAAVAPAPAPEAPQFVQPQQPAPAAPAPAAFAPQSVEPVLHVPAPQPAASTGFVMPGAPVPLAAPGPSSDEIAARIGRHADVVPEPPKPPVAAAPRPVGYTASADPDIANRYRAVIHAADQAEVVPVEPAPVTGSWPAQNPSAFASVNVPTYAQYSSPSNRPAKTALSFGFVALFSSLAVVGMLLVALPDIFGLVRLGLVALAFVSGLVAIIVGIVGLVVAHRVRVGRGAALGGLLLGVLVSIVFPAGFIAFSLWVASSLGLLVG
ncbi:DUF2510 domain-containing protein [Protaetiibacter intestinalis]|uniref:DUF2510 domain-containing protein n=1 Tax=Protaetiibacter intestinalis TaxID=2419774 RepID=A0A387B9L5_9MICO|nr:DUF2510 domain-containing protein [Protaetiibacter intestinalis]AYF98541.1 DUF2510 domain-containing protein [Protaetiibacter intestinalis]